MEKSSRAVRTPTTAVKCVSLLQCCVCLEPFSTSDPQRAPRLLSCGHSLCTMCIGEMGKTGAILCPLDRQDTPFKGDDANQLPKNFQLIELMERLLKEQNSVPHSTTHTVKDLINPKVMCGACGKAEASIFCHHCHAEICQDFCLPCFEAAHSVPLTRKHRRVPIAERPPRQVMCKQHPQERIKLLCTQDQELICQDCFNFGTHKGHNAVLLTESASSAKAALKALADRAHADLTSLERLAKQDADCVPAVISSSEQASKTVIDHFRALHAALTQREMALLTEMNAERDRRLECTQTRRKNTAVNMSEVTAALEEASRVLAREPIGLLAGKQSAEAHLNSSHQSSGAWVNRCAQIPTDITVHLPHTLSKSIASHGCTDRPDLPKSSEREEKEKREVDPASPIARCSDCSARGPDRFDECSKGIAVSESGAVATHEPTSCHHWVLGQNRYSGQDCVLIRLRVIAARGWLMVGVVGETPDSGRSFRSETCFAVSSKTSYSAGVNNGSKGNKFKAGDLVEVELDCAQSRLRVSNATRGLGWSEQFRLSGSDEWRLHVNMIEPNSSVGIVETVWH